MALINCPSCNNRISDKAVKCSHCGFELKGASSDDILRKQNLQRFKRGQSIQTQSMVAMLMFIGGFAFWKLGNPPTDSMQVKLAWSSIVIGFVWYLVNRVRLVMHKRKD